MIGTSAALLTTTLAGSMPGAITEPADGVRRGVGRLLVYAVGFAASFWLPEPDAIRHLRLRAGLEALDLGYAIVRSSSELGVDRDLPWTLHTHE